jgi:type IV pilus assembly protein PilP
MILDALHKRFSSLMMIFVTVILTLTTTLAQVKAQAPPVDSTVSDDKSTIEERIKVAKALEELLESMKTADFTYQTEGRSDPFEPFISEKIMQEAAETSTPEKLTGMRQFEPGQLSLVAIMFTESNPMAMVEDSSHKGYIIRRGTKIGKSGVVSDILPNIVIIKQLSYSMTKEKKYKTVELSLRKEGEK